MEGHSILGSERSGVHHLSTSLSAILQSEVTILGLSRPQTLSELNSPYLQQLFASGRLAVPQFDDQKCVATQLKQWCEKNQPDYLLAIGGDGTLNLACQAILEREQRLILIPAGTANDFASGLPSSQPDQLVWSDVDIVKVKSPDHSADTGFINMLAVGCGARHSSDVDSEIKATWGSMAYLIQAWQTLGDLRGFGLKLTCDHEVHVFDEVVQLFVANGRTCGGGYCVVDSARYDDGMMDLVVIQQGSALQIAAFIQSFMLGNHLENELCRHIRCSQAEVELSFKDTMTLDGEPSHLQRAELQVVPGRLPITKLESTQLS